MVLVADKLLSVTAGSHRKTNVINIGFISGNIRNEKSSRLWNLFYQIKNGTGFWQRMKNQQERV